MRISCVSDVVTLCLFKGVRVLLMKGRPIMTDGIPDLVMAEAVVAILTGEAILMFLIAATYLLAVLRLRARKQTGRRSGPHSAAGA